MASIVSLIKPRLRHLNAVSVWNLVLGEDEAPPFAVFFALSLPHGDDLGFFYRSLDECNCLHPEWKFLDLSVCSHAQQVAQDFVVSVLVRFENTGYCRLMRQWRIHVSGLHCVGQDIPSMASMQNNDEVLILHFGDKFYTTPVEKETTVFEVEPGDDSRTSVDRRLDLNLFPRADEASVRQSYSLAVLSRINRLSEEHMKVNDDMRQAQETCLLLYSKTQTTRQQKCELEAKRSRLQVLRQQIAQARETLAARISRLNLKSDNNSEKELQLRALKEEIRKKNENLLTATNVYQRLRSDLKEYQIQIVRRRLVLARALHAIFPIKKVNAESGSTSASYSICGLNLPESDDISYTGFPEAHFTAAYGFAAQLLRLLSFITDVPLRYPIVIHNARLHVRDNIVCQLEQNERNFPLHLRRQKNDRIRFAYAVFLLNRDISLLRLACGLALRKLPSTLYNVSDLLRSPLTPGCSAETFNAAEKLIEENARVPVFAPQPALPSPVLEEQPVKAARAAASVINPDIYFHGDVMDLTT